MVKLPAKEFKFDELVGALWNPKKSAEKTSVDAPGALAVLVGAGAVLIKFDVVSAAGADSKAPHPGDAKLASSIP